MKHTESQEKAIRSKKDKAEEEGKFDKEGRVKCKECGKMKEKGEPHECENETDEI